MVTGGLRQDLKHLMYTNRKGFFPLTGNLVQWQKWRFRVGFNYREGATLHDICMKAEAYFIESAIVRCQFRMATHGPLPPKQALTLGMGRRAGYQQPSAGVRLSWSH
ncbi:hypothetical protein BGX38DRAFT_1335367 [Terfezia claveryi]|nr:hypothetical protein BGX38DRAFT_1335367 [Terfezia claveryi]